MQPPKKPNALYVHLQELRFRGTYFLLSLLVTFFAGTLHSNQLMHLICTPFAQGKENCTLSFIFTDLTEGLYTTINLSFMVAFSLCTPLLIYHCWSFFIPSCYERERSLVNMFLLSSAFLFCSSVFFAYLFILPKICGFLQQFAVEDICFSVQLQPRIGGAVQWSCTTTLLIILFFQIPLLFSMLLRGGFIDSGFLRKNRKYALFSLLLLASFFSPPDASSQCLLGGAAFCLYESLLWSALFQKKWSKTV